ncbi:hypothetical protein FSP39_008902 [Pinctada imbricata]|uniref:Uncharacterized protein n=1 Tax=Pinctada imbricata TaxID=66713 RepID=A0AA88YH02_PINIB|nr:hypothetical protein FSP39_008902 [Pinctada imbricata]
MDRKVKVIIWKYTSLRNVGHAALELSDGTYISWWPMLKKDNNFKGMATAMKSVEAMKDRTFEKDKDKDEGEGREPDEIVEIPVSQEQEQAIKNWWTGVLANHNERYHLRTNNCSTMVYRALREAGCFKAKREPVVSAWTPNMVLKYAKQCQKDKAKAIDILDEVVEEYIEASEKRIVSGTN